MTDIRFDRHMSDADALMWAIEKDPVLRSTILAMAVLDRPPDRDRLRERLERGSRVIPRLRQRVATAPLVASPPRWVTEPEVDLGYHLRFVRTGGDGSPRDLLDLAAPLAMQSFDRARPLWEFVVVEGLADGRAALLQKVHHSVTDGVGGMKLAMVLLDLEREPAADPGPVPEAPPADQVGPWRLLREAVGHERRRQLGVARRALGNVTRTARRPLAGGRRLAGVAGSAGRILAPATQPQSPIMTERSLRMRFDMVTAPLSELKAAARLADGKLNDAFVAAVAGGLRRYHDAHGATVDALRMGMPINIRSEATESVAGNQFVPLRFLVPISIADPIERMRAVRQLVGEQRAEPALAFTEQIAGLLYRLPPQLTIALFGSMLKGVDFITSNVPGAPVPVYLAGAKVEATYAFAPMSGAAANVTLLSYLDDCHVGVNTDPAAVPDPELFVECLEASFDEIRKLA